MTKSNLPSKPTPKPLRTSLILMKIKVKKKAFYTQLFILLVVYIL